VYNQTFAGTYGLSVTPELISLDLYQGINVVPLSYMTGLHNWGQAGFNGFRTSIGVYNPHESSVTANIVVVSPSGNIVWQRSATVAGQTQSQFSMPQDIYLSGGHAIVGTGGSLGVVGYATVTDNETGDGRYIAPSSLWDQAAKTHSNGPTVSESLEKTIDEIASRANQPE
jgi:hypothetical protein